MPASSRETSSSELKRSSMTSTDRRMLPTIEPTVRRQRLFLQRVNKEAQRMERLTQIVTRRGQESRLGDVGLFRRFTRLFGCHV